MKRSFDIVGAAGGLLFFLPVMAVVAIAILLDDGRPTLFGQRRLGAGRRPFRILKFRSMRDGRVTRVGRVLRATGLDELPQLLNVLRGEMSAVGPRPLESADVERLGWNDARVDFRWRVRPGLTGLAQLMAVGSSRSTLVLDRVYLARQTLWLDARLVALSFVVNAIGKRRVRRLIARRPRGRQGAARAAACLAAITAVALLATPLDAVQRHLKPPDVRYVPTPQNVVEAMLDMARVTPADVVYDLGSGDGRIPITAAEKYGARGVGVEIEPRLVEIANDTAKKARVTERVWFLNQDLFETDLAPATVVTLYLLPRLNQQLMPKLKALRPGTRIVSHYYDMGPEWPPDQSQDINSLMIYLWTIR